jgi:hypothetical protein
MSAASMPMPRTIERQQRLDPVPAGDARRSARRGQENHHGVRGVVGCLGETLEAGGLDTLDLLSDDLQPLQIALHLGQGVWAAPARHRGCASAPGARPLASASD